MTSPTAARRPAIALLATAGSAAAFAACVIWVHDPDTFHHLAYGREVARAGLRGGEPFLFPLLGAPGGPLPYWLGSLAIYGWHALFGDGGLAFLPAAVAATLFAILFVDAAPRGGRHTPFSLAAAALPLALAMETFRYRATARPDTFGVLFLAATLWAVRRFEDGRPRMLLAFPLLALAWTNVHPSAVTGLAAVGLLAAVSAAGGAPRRPRAALQAAGLLLAGAVASVLNPSPANPVLLALRFGASLFGLGRGAAGAAAGDPHLALRMLVSELTPPGWGFLATAPGLLFSLTVLSFLVRRRGVRVREVLTVAVFAALASRGVRFAAVLAVVCAPIAARNLAEALAAVPERVGRLRLRGAAAAAAALAALVHPALAAVPPEISFGTRLWPPAYPVRAADYLAQVRFDGHLYDTFEFGGYLEWRGLHPYQDGRGAVPPGTLEASIVGPSDPRTFAPLDERYRFDALLVEYPTLPPARAEELRALKGDDDWLVDRRAWALVAFDDGGLLYLRRDGRYAGEAARDELRLAKPANGATSVRLSQLPALVAEYERSVSEAPSCLRCRFLLATFALAAGNPAQAQRVLAPALPDAERRLPEILSAAAQAAEAQGDPATARGLYRRYLSTGSGDRGARRALARLELASGEARLAEGTLRPSLQEGTDVEDAALASRIALARGRPDEAARWDAWRARAGGLDVARQRFEEALAAERLGDLDRAIASYAASLSVLEASPVAHSNLGFVLQKAGRRDEALREQRRALEIDPRYAAAHYGVGMLLAERGDRAGAAEAFRRYLALEPNGYWALKATQLVSELERP
jgi:tetratricopeptide (TPR) repeat protein